LIKYVIIYIVIGANLKNNNYRILIIGIALIFLVVIFYFLYNKSLDNRGEILYKMTYYDDLISGSSSDIQIYEDKIKITTTRFCSYVNCSLSEEIEILN